MGALRLGALDADQPPAPGSPGFGTAARRLVATVKAMAGVKVVRHWRPSAAPPPAPPPPTLPVGGRARGVAVVATTGGPAALQRLLAGLPADFPAPILVVQHITSGFTSGLADWLDTVCPARVKVAREGESLAPSTAYFAPDDRHLGVSGRGLVALSSAPPLGGVRPAGPLLLGSVAGPASGPGRYHDGHGTTASRASAPSARPVV
ncbi:MAG: CheB methylesterase domain-containing protein [Singulisphaera sp.]